MLEMSFRVGEEISILRKGVFWAKGEVAKVEGDGIIEVAISGTREEFKFFPGFEWHRSYRDPEQGDHCFSWESERFTILSLAH